MTAVPHSLTRSPQTVASLRGEIDRIDDAMLDLVDARVSLTRAMAALKDDASPHRLKLRPRREIDVLTRLAARARVAEPRMIEHIWRTLMAYGLNEQAPMQLVLYADAATDRLALHECVRTRFGPAAALRWAADEDEALDAARETEAIAVVAGPVPPALRGTARADDVTLRLFETIGCGDHLAYAIGRVAAEDVAHQEPVR